MLYRGHDVRQYSDDAEAVAERCGKMHRRFSRAYHRNAEKFPSWFHDRVAITIAYDGVVSFSLGLLCLVKKTRDTESFVQFAFDGCRAVVNASYADLRARRGVACKLLLGL
jgi:hypothetical protein